MSKIEKEKERKDKGRLREKKRSQNFLDPGLAKPEY